MEQPGTGSWGDNKSEGNAADRWNFFDKLVFSWIFKVLPAARRGEVTVDELPLPTAQFAENCYVEFNANWEAALQEAKSTGIAPNLLKVLFKTYGKDAMRAGIFKIFWSIFVITGAYFFTRSILMFVRTMEGKENSVYNEPWKGWVLTAFFFVDAWLLGLSLQRMAFGCLRVGIRCRAALISAVTKKCFNMAYLSKGTASQAVSFVASDINKVYEGIQEIHYLWTAPFEAIALVALLASLVGWYCLAGAAVLCVIVPAQYVFGFKIIQNKMRNSPNVRDRGGIIQEILPAMKLVKYYAWEQFFEKEISEIRKREMKYVFRNCVVKIINITMVFGTPPLVALAVMGSYELTKTAYTTINGVVYAEQKVDPQIAFTMLSLFNIMRFPLVVLPKALRCVTEALTSIRKLEDFMIRRVVAKQNIAGGVGVKMSRAAFQYRGNNNFTLRVPDFSVKPGELVAVVGRVGAGKSALFQAILGNMDLVKGEAHAGGKVAYVPQNPWCQNLTLQENILFGKPMNRKLYNEVIHACALDFDMRILPLGDQSKAGLRGINLAGGQRQRLNLARCAYFDGDVILLDNALSAVDHHTSHHIFDTCIRGVMSGRAVVLVTHQLEFLSQCDKVAIMNDGEMLYFGPWNNDAQQLLSKYLPESCILAAAGGGVVPKKHRRPPSGIPLSKDDFTQERMSTVTSVSLGRAIWEYLCVARWWLFCCSLLFFLAAQTSRQMADEYVRWWTSDRWEKYPAGRAAAGRPPCEGWCGDAYYVGMYGILNACFLTFMLLRGSFLYLWALGASRRLHKGSIHRILYAPLSFFFTTPVGDLLLSFTRDQDVLDEALPDALYYAGIYGLILLATTITVSTTIPLFSAFAAGLLLVSFIMLVLHLPAATHLKKLRMETTSELVTLVAESLDGLGIIQAFGRQQYFVEVADMQTNLAHRALFNAETLNLWLAFFCDFYGAILILSVSSFAIAQRDHLGSSAVGLAFSQSIQMLVFYTWSVRLVADCISLFGSVEKLAFLANHAPQEGGAVAQDGAVAPHASASPPEGWPRTGVVFFENVWMQYAPNAPFALRGVTFQAQHAEKIGVVGRTGSGKSTLLLALHRMFNLEKGRIVVDGVDVSTISLFHLRRGLSVIPQEPVVFSGTVRTNLDPFKQFVDADMWEVIKEVGLEQQVTNVGGLDGKVDGTGGQAWSLGQQQLVCLARASLKKVPVVCMDEATVAMDPHTEQLVLEVCERIFTARTSFSIAHRLDVVIKADNIMVMEAGELVEMDTPAALLDDPGSMFSRLVDKQGPQAAACMRKVAADCLAAKTSRVNRR